MQLNSAPLISREAIKGPSSRPLNPTPTVFYFSTEISQKYNTTSKEVMLNNQKDFKGWKDSVLAASFVIYRFRACLRGGGGPRVGEVTRLGRVTRLSI